MINAILIAISIISILINMILLYKLSSSLDRLEEHMIDYEMLYMKIQQLLRN